METTRKCVYPVHKLDAIPPKTIEEELADTADRDTCLKAHYFDLLMPQKFSIKKVFKQLSKPNKIQHGTIPIRPDFYSVNESKVSTFDKLGIHDDEKRAFLLQFE